MSSVQLVSLFQTVLSLMITTFPVIDTDDKKKKVSDALEPLLHLFLDADKAYNNSPWFATERVTRNIMRFIDLIKISPISLELLLKRIENQYNEIKKNYEEELSDAARWYCCPLCSSFEVPMERVLDNIHYNRAIEKEIFEYGYDALYPDVDFQVYEPDSDKVKLVLQDSHDKKVWKHLTKDVPRHQRNKTRVETKKAPLRAQPISREPSVMKSTRFLVNDFHL
jgi:hypothetical protein